MTIDSQMLALPQIIAGKSKDIERLNFKGIDRKKNPIINGEPLNLRVHTTIGEAYEHNPSGNLLSSTNELIQWTDELIKVYNQSSTNPIITKIGLDTITWQNQYLVDENNISIGLGWWINEDIRYGKSYFNVGTNPGYCSILMIYPKEQFGIVILSNGWYRKDVIWKKLFYEIVELYIGE